MPTVGEHAGKEIASQQSEAAEKRSIDGDDADAAQALIAVCRAEDERREQYAERNSVEQSNALRLQIAAKDELFGESDEDAEKPPGCEFNCVGGCEFHQLLCHLRLFLQGRFGLG